VLKLLAWAFGILFLLLIVISVSSDHISSPSPRPKTPQEIEDAHYESAAGACLLWAEKHSPLAMGDFVDDYQLPRRKRDPKDVYRAGLHYRTKSAGLMMRADCASLMTKDDKVIIVEAQARPGE
jgi:hypothetical protein